MMTDDEKVKLAVNMCLERAAEADNVSDREAFRLWAKILPVVAQWEHRLKTDTPEMLMDDYITAAVSVCATFMAQCVRNASGDEADVINKIGPLVAANFSMLLHKNCFHGTCAAVLGRGDA